MKFSLWNSLDRRSNPRINQGIKISSSGFDYDRKAAVDDCSRWIVWIWMAIWAIIDPNILLAPESHKRHRARKGSVPFSAGVVEYNADRMRIVLVTIHQHQRPVSVGTAHRVRSDQHITF